jgi:hypothetical protein
MALIYLERNIMLTENDDSKRELKEMVMACFKLLIRICMNTLRKAMKLHSHHGVRMPHKHKSVVGFVSKVSGFPFLIWSKPLPLILTVYPLTCT